MPLFKPAGFGDAFFFLRFQFNLAFAAHVIPMGFLNHHHPPVNVNMISITNFKAQFAYFYAAFLFYFAYRSDFYTFLFFNFSLRDIPLAKPVNKQKFIIFIFNQSAGSFYKGYTFCNFL